MGVPVGGVKLACFVLSSLLAAFTGIIQFGSFGSATPTQGSDLALTAIVVAVVGGASLLGGRGSIMGALARSDRAWNVLHRPRAVRRLDDLVSVVRRIPASLCGDHQSAHRGPWGKVGSDPEIMIADGESTESLACATSQ